MKRLAIAILVGTAICLVSGAAFLASALDREVTQAELDRIEAVRQRNAERGYSWQAGVTSISHLTDEELLSLCRLKIPPDLEARRAQAKREGRMIEAIPGMFFPQAFDWRTQGVVTPIKNQGNCGSCWAFAAAAAFESQILLHSGLEENLSEQAVMDCNTVGDGCGGGWMSTCYDMWMDYGAVRESCVPYHEVDTDPCIQASCDVAATLDNYYPVADDVNSIKTALLDGPVAAALAVCGGFQTYTGGCYEDACTEINHGMLIVGWDDTMCDGVGAWIVKNSWAPTWGVDGYIYMQYGTCYIGYGAEALNYTPGQTVHFFYDSHSITDGGDGDGAIEVGEAMTMPVTILNIGAETATSVSAKLRSLTSGVVVTDSSATYPDMAKGATAQSNANHFGFTVTAAGPSCGSIRFQMEVTSGQGTSFINITLQAGTIATAFEDDLETNKGWSLSATGDNATTGLWTRVDPNGTWWGSQPVQPESDHTASPGTVCMVTGQGSVGGAQGAADVDGGKTTLTSPTVDLSGKNSALLSYWRWYASETGSAPNDDDFVVDVSNNNGSTWVNLETLIYSDRTWRKMEFYLEDYVTLTNQIKVRFIAQDTGSGSIVEAGVDDFSIRACQNAAPDAVPPTVTVVDPNGGETATASTQYEIEWTATDNVGVTSVSIYLSTDGGSTYPATVATGEANDGSFMWTVPDLDSKTARIKVVAYDAALNQGSDASDANFTLWGTTSGVRPEPQDVPEEVVLRLADGNPVSASSRIIFGVPADMRVRLAVYDVTGRMLGRVFDRRVEAGYTSMDWAGIEGRGLGPASGVYFLRLETDRGVRTLKVVRAR
ncbi:MAG: C1 family peptidase [bacterium]